MEDGPTDSVAPAWRAWASAFAAACLVLTACPATPPPPPAPEALEANLADIARSVTLGPGDVFEVRVYRQKELSGLHRVGPDGTIRFPLIGSIEVMDRTPEAVSDMIRSRLIEDGFLRDPQVTVFVREFRSKKVFVLGQVQKPGTFAYSDKMNLIEAVTLAGGFTPLAARNRTVITRIREGKELRILVPADEISEGRRPNPPLKPGDIVFVPESIL